MSGATGMNRCAQGQRAEAAKRIDQRQHSSDILRPSRMTRGSPCTSMAGVIVVTSRFRRK
jgi:hypothetical protein